MTKNDRPSIFARAMSRTTSVPHSVHLSKLDDQQLSALHDSLIYQHDAHCHREWNNGKRTRRVSKELREYLKAVRIEVLTRKPLHTKTDTPERYESRRPVNVLKRAATHVGGAGTSSLADLQAEYTRRK